MDAGKTEPWRAEREGLILTVRLTPRGGRDSIDGRGILSDGRPVILARVRQVPEDGAANAALLKLVAKSAGLPASAAEVIAGHTSRLKTVRLSGDADRIAAALADCLDATDNGAAGKSARRK